MNGDMGEARLAVAEEEEAAFEAKVKGMGRIGRIAEEFQSRRIEWNQFCDYVRTECAGALDLPPTEASKLKLEALVRMAKKVEDAQEGRL